MKLTFVVLMMLLTCSSDTNKCLNEECVIVNDNFHIKQPVKTTNECVDGWVFLYTGTDPNFKPPESGCVPMSLYADAGYFTWCCPWDPNN